MFIRKHPNPAEYTCEVRLLADCPTQVTTCAGCFGALKPDGKIPAIPHDLVVVSFMLRSFPVPGRERVAKFGNAYFHLRKSCIAKEIAEFQMEELIVRDDVKANLKLVHRRYLRAAIGNTFSV